jgi:DNA repair exonuclease SbcCD ATPase subunit
MKLLRLQAKNIFSLGEIDVNLADRGLVLVTGHSLDEGSSNGSGKSSIANKGILWSLYGSTAGGLKADDVLNRHGNTKSGWGRIDFLGVDNVKYTVTRARPAKLELLRDGKDISAKKATETQKLIDQALGLDYASFLHTYMFGQGRINSYASLAPAEQKAILEQILPIEQLSVWAEYTKECRIKLGSAYAILTQEISKIEGEISVRKVALKTATDKALMWTRTREEQLEKAFISLEKHKAVLADRHERITALESELAKINGLDDEINKLETTIEQCNAELNDLQSQLNIIHDRSNQWAVTRTINLSKIVKIIGGECPTCNREILDDGKLKEILEFNAVYQKAVDEAQTNIDRCSELFLQATESKITKLEYSANLFTHKSILESMRKKQTYLMVQIAELKGVTDETESFTRRAEEIAAEQNPFADMVEDFTKQLSDSERKMVPLQTLKTKIEEEKEHLNWWQKVYGTDIKNRMFENVCHFLDTQTNEYLKELKNPQLKVQFSTVKKLASGEVKEDFNVRVYSEKGGEGFDTLSGGEQQMVSFAIGKALGDLCKAQSSGSSDFQILDEPFSMLDPRNCENLIEFLSKEQGTIMLISNDENLMNLVPERLHVEKYKGVTTVAYGG